MRGETSAPGAVDEAVNLVESMGPGYVAGLALASLPWRFGVATLASQALELKSEAINVAPYWESACAVLAGLFVIHVFAQTVFVRGALLTTDEGAAPVRDTLKSALAALPSVLGVSALIEAAFFLAFPTVVLPFLMWTVSGVVLGAHPTIGVPSLLGPWRALAAERPLFGRFVALHALLFLVLLVVMINLGVLCQALPALLGLIPGFPVERVLAAISSNDSRVLTGLWAMAAALIEPVRLAASTLLCFERTALRSGRDLRARIRVLSLRATNT